MALITPVGTADYKSKVNALLAQIRKNPVGNVILSGLVKQVSVFPIEYHYNRASGTWDDAASCKAIAAADDRDASNLRIKKPGEAGYDARRDKYYLGNPTNRFGTHENRTPTGSGSSSAVFFTPGEGGQCKNEQGHLSRIDLDAALLHEIVHSLRMSMGIVSAVPTATNEFVNEEEFLAIEITNMYLSARDKKGAKLIHSHWANASGDPEWDDPAEFVNDHDNSFVLRQHKDWSIFKELAKLKDIKFNPFYEFERRAKAEAAKRKTPAAAQGR